MKERWKGYRDKQDERGGRDIEINKMKEGEGEQREREVGEKGYRDKQDERGRRGAERERGGG